MQEQQAALCTRCAATAVSLTNAAVGTALDAEPETALKEYRERVRQINKAKDAYLALVCEFIEFKWANPGLPSVDFFFLGIPKGDILDALEARGKHLFV